MDLTMLCNAPSVRGYHTFWVWHASCSISLTVSSFEPTEPESSASSLVGRHVLSHRRLYSRQSLSRGLYSSSRTFPSIMLF